MRIGSAFYENSRKNSGAWHGLKSGNGTNLRSSRARRRTVPRA